MTRITRTPEKTRAPMIGTSQRLDKRYIKSHSRHSDAPILEYFPDGQFVHSAAPSPEYVFGEHASPAVVFYVYIVYVCVCDREFVRVCVCVLREELREEKNEGQKKRGGGDLPPY